MKVKLNYTGTVDVYDVNTTYAASMNALVCNVFVSGPRRTEEILAKKRYKKSFPNYLTVRREICLRMVLFLVFGQTKVN